MSLNNIYQKFRFVKEEISQAVNGQAFLQHLEILNVTQEQKEHS